MGVLCGAVACRLIWGLVRKGECGPPHLVGRPEDDGKRFRGADRCTLLRCGISLDLGVGSEGGIWRIALGGSTGC